jgi:3-dehydroquinate synthetase
MVAAASVSRALGICDGDAVARIRAVTGRAGLPTEVPADLDRGTLAGAMRADKKSQRGTIRFVALEAIGRVRPMVLTAAEIARHL